MTSPKSHDSPAKRIFRPHTKFSAADDAVLRSAVETQGFSNWTAIALAVGDKSPRQCKERWFNYLSPDLKVGDWTCEEDSLILRKFAELGHKWVKIAQFLPNRTDSMVKNRHHQLERRQLKANRIFQTVQRFAITPTGPPLEEIAHFSPVILRDEETEFASLSSLADDTATLWGTEGGFDAWSSYPNCADL
jgi:hypothetical protein